MNSKEAQQVIFRSHFIKIACLLIIVFLMEFLFLAGLEISEQSIVTTPDKKEHLYPISVQGLKLQSFKGNRISNRAVAQELKVNPRKFFIFNIKPFNELTLNNVTMEFYKSDDEPSGIDLGDPIDKIAPHSKKTPSSSKGLDTSSIKTGIITRGIINRLILKIYNEKSLSKIIKTPRAYLNFKKDEVIFRNVTVEDVASKKVIKSRKMIFKNGEDVLRVPGKYILRSSTGSQKGKGLNINL